MLTLKHKIKVPLLLLSLLFLLVSAVFVISVHSASAQTIPPGCPGGAAGPPAPGTVCPSGTIPKTVNLSTATPPNTTACGAGPSAVHPSIDIGCSGLGNPILDATFAILRFLSYGVGVVVIASIVYAGIQYTLAGDDPKSIALARERIRSSVIALLIFIFASAMLDFILPAGFLK